MIAETEELHLTKHNPNKPVRYFFDEKKVSALILEWQKTGNAALITEIWAEAESCVDALIRGKNFKFLEHDELKTMCYQKLCRMLPKFNPEEGRIFSFLTHCLTNFLITSLNSQNFHSTKFQVTDFSSMPEFFTGIDDGSYVTELSETYKKLAHRVASIVVPFADPKLAIGAAKLIPFLADNDFEMSRREVLAFLKEQIGFSGTSAQRIYGFTLIAIRRELYADIDFALFTKLQERSDLVGFQEIKEQLSASDFERFINLTHGVDPHILDLRCVDWILTGKGLITFPRDHIARLTPEYELELVALYRTGITSKQIAIQCEIPFATLLRILRKHNVLSRDGWHGKSRTNNVARITVKTEQWADADKELIAL